MKITHLGASTIIVEHKKKKILFDPWLDDGIVYGAWYDGHHQKFCLKT